MVVATALLAAATTALHVVDGATPLTSWWYGNSVFAVAVTAPGALIVAHRPRNPIGRLMCLAGLAEGLCGTGREYLVFGALGHRAPGSLWIGWFCDSLYLVSMATLPAMLVAFPNGQPTASTWRWVTRLMPVAGLLGVVGYLFTGDGVARIRGHEIVSPAAGWLPQGLTTTVAGVGQVMILGGIVAGIAGLALRYRTSRGVERDQLKWLGWAGSITAVEVLSEVTVNPISTITGSIVTVLLAASVATAILRHHLLDIDLVIARTLVFVLLTLVVAGGYLGVVLGVGLLIGEPTHIGAALLATAVVAVGFAPLRQQVQRWVERLVYGERANPYGVVTRLGHHLESGDADPDLAVVLDTVARALKLPYAALAGADGEMVAEIGSASSALVRQDLRYGGASIGTLLLGMRNAGTSLDAKDGRFLEDLSPHVAAAVRATSLASDLQRSRHRLVTAKEEERRRLRRDLHDGVGPRLAALGLKLDAARLMVDRRPDEASALIAVVKSDIRSTLDDIRRLVYGLRPPALDQLGLIGALRERAGELDSSAAGGGVRFVVDGPDDVAALPAAAEVAVFWIATEAMTNVVRHANASRCEVRVQVSHELELDVIDDGMGLAPAWRPGVGTSSMAERASELGGCCKVEAAPDHGVRVFARLPLDEVVSS